MNEQTSSIVSIVFVLVGLLTVLIMLKLHGNPLEKTPMKRLRNIHRILGYVFLVYFLLMMVLMLNRIGGGEAEFSPRVVVHMVLAMTVLPLLVFKILIARFFKRLFPHMILLGLAIFILYFALVFVTGGYNLLQGTGTMPEIPEGNSTEARVDSRDIKTPEPFRAAIKALIQKKCTVCHDLVRVRVAKKTSEQWQATVERMIKYNANADFLSETEKTLILSFLSSEWKKDL